MPKATFLANPAQAIKNAEIIPVGNTRTPHTRLQFNLEQFKSETPTVQASVIDALDSSIVNKYMCTESKVGATSCHVNNGGAYIYSTGYTVGGDIYVSKTDSAGSVVFAKAEILGTFDVPASYNSTTAQTNFEMVNNQL